MAVFIDIVRLWNSPTEEKVTKTSSNTHGYKKPSIVSHRDQHQEITDRNLKDVKERLQEMVPVAEAVPERKNVLTQIRYKVLNMVTESSQGFREHIYTRCLPAPIHRCIIRCLASRAMSIACHVVRFLLAVLFSQDFAENFETLVKDGH